MFKISLQKYRLKDFNADKQAAFILCSEVFTDQNLADDQAKLIELLSRQYDTYIWVASDPRIVNTRMVQLMLAFKKTYSGPVGLMIKGQGQLITDALRLKDYFVIDNEPKHLLAKLEASRKNK